MSDIVKFRRVALVLSVIIGLVILWFLYQQARGMYVVFTSGARIYGGLEENIFYSFLAINYASIPIMLSSLIIGYSLLHSIRKEESPFIKKNATKLKIIAILLVVFELFVIISQEILFRFFFRFENQSDSFLIETSLGGVVIVMGLIVYCIALVFEYGISLQNQVDETL